MYCFYLITLFLSHFLPTAHVMLQFSAKKQTEQSQNLSINLTAPTKSDQNLAKPKNLTINLTIFGKWSDSDHRS